MERYNFLIDRMWEELNDAKTYARKALLCKEDKAYADVMADLARQEYNHFSILHTQTAMLANAWSEGEMMRHVWMVDRERLIERAGEVKTLVDMYRV